MYLSRPTPCNRKTGRPKYWPNGMEHTLAYFYGVELEPFFLVVFLGQLYLYLFLLFLRTSLTLLVKQRGSSLGSNKSKFWL